MWSTYLPPEKSVSRSRSNSSNQTWYQIWKGLRQGCMHKLTEVGNRILELSLYLSWHLHPHTDQLSVCSCFHPPTRPLLWSVCRRLTPKTTFLRLLYWFSLGSANVNLGRQAGWGEDIRTEGRGKPIYSSPTLCFGQPLQQHLCHLQNSSSYQDISTLWILRYHLASPNLVSRSHQVAMPPGL